MRTDVDNLNNDYVLYFSAGWCAPCKHLKPIMESLSEKYPEVDIFYVDVDQHQDIAVENKVMAVPTVKFISGQQERKVLTGLQPQQTYEALIQEYYYEV